MKKMLFLHPYFQFLLIAILVFAAIEDTFAQSTKSDKGDEKDNQTTLQGLTEAILIDGKPALKIISQKSGSTEIRLQQREGEDTLVFSVTRLKPLLWSLTFGESGKLYLTKTRIIYDPEGNKKHFFNITRKEVKKSSRDSEGMGGGAFNFIKIQTEKDTFKFVVSTSQEYGFFNRKDTMPSLDFLLRALTNFDSTLVEFNQLTASVRLKDEEEEEGEEDNTKANVSDKYDRFKDITIISTSKMLVRGNKRSIRTYAEYSFAGKTQKKPEKVSLYFYASAASPLFREDNIELNFLVDDKRVSLGKMKLADEEKTKTTTKQTAVVAMPYETFEQIANGKKVEFQIGTLEYKLTNVHLEAFRKLLTYKIEE